jgi:DNA-binding NarL/FixJ family response regulator
MRALLVDDHEEVRAMLRVGLSRRASLKIVGEAGCLADAVHMAGRLRPEAIVLDLGLPDTPRYSHVALSAIRQASPNSQVVVFTAHDSDREWYEHEGVRFFGKATDVLDDLANYLDAARPTSPR